MTVKTELFALQTEATNMQKSMNVTRNASVSAADGNIRTAVSKQPAAERKLRGGGQTVPDTAKPVKSSVPSKATATKQQVRSHFSRSISFN